MTPERWVDVERLYYAALERNPDERAAFLTGACADEALRHEVESLFAYQAKARDFIETPAAHIRLASALRGLEQPSLAGRFVGRVFGCYQLETLIAAGGMGEVYRAVDTRLNRTVAIKTLPEHLSNDPERRERFTREAKIVSSLNHPHICTLYDVGMQDGIQYLVMEHIEGETLRKRLERGALPLARALEYAIQICDALDKAHRRGVIHRDLNPANVMLTSSGVKLLDFGLAGPRTPAGETNLEIPSEHRSEGLTADGTIMGTIPYIAPEQVEGKLVDVRSDIFAFGGIAYEMITGIRAFRGESQAALMNAILNGDPQPIVELVPDVPLPLAQTLSRCLAKDPNERWQTANDLLFQLRSIASSPAALDAHESAARHRRRRIERALWTTVVVVSMVGMFLWARSRDVRSLDSAKGGAAVRYKLFPADGTAFYSSSDLPFALSPDGRHIVYVSARADGMRQLWLRSLYSEVEQPMSGTEAANAPFWSTDSQWIGFFAGNSLKKVRVSTGLTQIVASGVTTRGGAAWNADDVIVFSSGPGGLSRVSAQGGPVSRATTTDEGNHFWPQFLGDGQHLIYAAAVPGTINITSLGNEAPRVLMKFPVRISSLGYVPGYVFFVQDSTLFARPFDEKRLEFSGEAVRIVDGIPIIAKGRAAFSVSAAGVLAYWPYPVGMPAVLQWFERDGRASAAVDTPAQYVGFAISPDDRRLVFSRTAKNGGADLWLRDLTDGIENQLTFDGAAYTPQWSPDGARIVFSGPGERPPPKLFIKNVAGTGAASQFGTPRAPTFASGWSGDGRSIVSVRLDSVNSQDLWVQRVQDAAAEPLPFNTPFNESHGKVSPDNRWIAYATDASGKDEVWVASFPSGAIRRQVSAGGGSAPEWGEDSKEILYISDDKRLMATRVSAGQAGVDVGNPRVLFQIKNLVELDPLVFPSSNAYVSASNGRRFLVAVSVRDPNAPPINIVVNWRALLNR